MHLNKIYLHASIAVAALVLSAFVDEDSVSAIGFIRKFYGVANIIFLIVVGILAASITFINDPEAPVSVRAENYSSFIPSLNSQAQQSETALFNVPKKQYDFHILTNLLIIVGGSGLLTLVYHLLKGDSFVLVWHIIFIVASIYTCPLFDAHLLRANISRPFILPTLTQDYKEIRRSIDTIQRDVKKELQETSDSINGKANKKGGSASRRK